jgi:prophage regulatory protein
MKLLKLPQVLELTTTSRTTQYALIKEGLMTTPVALGIHAVAWPENEIIKINSARVAGKSEDEIRQLVSRLMNERKSLTI